MRLERPGMSIQRLRLALLTSTVGTTQDQEQGTGSAQVESFDVIQHDETISIAHMAHDASSSLYYFRENMCAVAEFHHISQSFVSI